MSRRVCVGLAVLFCWMSPALWTVPQAAAPQGPPASAAPSSTADSRAVLDRYCVTCHNERAKIAGLTLDKVDLSDIPANADVLEKVVRKVRVGMMPPQGAPRPDQAAATALVAHLTRELDRAALAKPNPGRGLIHRLNRVEYAERHPRSVLARDRRVGDAAARRRGVRIRQHRGCARRLARPARALSDGGGQDHARWRSAIRKPRRRGRPSASARTRRRTRTSKGCRSAPSAGSWPRRRCRSTASTRSRSDCSAPISASSAASNTTISSSSPSTASACTCRRSAATTISRPTSRT